MVWMTGWVSVIRVAVHCRLRAMSVNVRDSGIMGFPSNKPSCTVLRSCVHVWTWPLVPRITSPPTLRSQVDVLDDNRVRGSVR